MRVDDDKEENDEDNVGDVAGILPDKVDRRVGFHAERRNDRKAIYDIVDSVDEFGNDTGGGADDPGECTDLVFASVGGCFVIGAFRIGVVGFETIAWSAVAVLITGFKTVAGTVVVVIIIVVKTVARVVGIGFVVCFEV